MNPYDEQRTRVLFLAAEADPLVKVGGLGDVAGSLPRALQALNAGLDVRLMIPFHAAIDRDRWRPRPIAEFPVPARGGWITARAYQVDLDGLPVNLIAGDPVPADGPVYQMDTQADGVKFAFFSLAALELARALGWAPHILHANDWHTALAVYQLQRLRAAGDPFFRDTRSVLGIHNLPFLGVGTEQAFDVFDLPPAPDPRLPEWARRMPFPAGLQAADRLIAVSPGYAQEIQTPEFGSGLELFLAARAADLTGILNGLDTAAWDPAADQAIPVRFDITSLDRRAENKAGLQAEFGLAPAPRTPLLGFIGRMDPQKGVDLAIDGLRRLSALPWQVILLGTGDPTLEKAAAALQAQFPDRVRAELRFDAGLARRIYAGADLLLMPSRYEPCGLAQMIAMRYGCLPLARATGGLRDTIDPQRTGFLFQQATPAALAVALQVAFDLYHANPAAWLERQTAAMQEDFSWERSAQAYAQQYWELRSHSV